MKSVLAALLVLCGTSGCYTVLRHPAVERTAAGTFYEETAYALGPMQDCAACHDTWAPGGFDPWLPPYPPLWLAYGTGPWWERTGIEQPQGHGLANARLRPPVEAPLPIAIDIPVDGRPVVKPPPSGLPALAASSPHPAAGGAPGVPAAAAGGRGSGTASTPHSGPDRTAPAPAPRPQEAPAAAPRAATPSSTAASEPPAPAHGAGMAHSRPRPS